MDTPGNLVDSPTHRCGEGVNFRIKISPRIRSQNRNRLKCSVRDLGQSDSCKTSEKLVHCHVPFINNVGNIAGGGGQQHRESWAETLLFFCLKV